MLNSDIDLDSTSSHKISGSKSTQFPQILTELSIESATALPILAEATQRAVRLSDLPVSILTTIDRSGAQISSIAGLDKFTHLSDTTNLSAKLAGWEYCHAQTIGGEGAFIATDWQTDPQLSRSMLYRAHGIRSYLGLQIVTAAQDIIGTIAILDFQPHQFSDRDIELLRLISRLVASECERKFLSQVQIQRWVSEIQSEPIRGFDDLQAISEHDLNNSSLSDPTLASSVPQPDKIAKDRSNLVLSEDLGQLSQARIRGEIQFKLLTYLSQELRTPLTAVLGMASVLQQEIYGSLSGKQKDYLGIVYQSAKQLVTIVDEIDRLGGFDLQQHKLSLKPVDPEMLCQLAIQSLEPLAQKKQIQIVMDFVGSDTCRNDRIWLLDKDKVQQIVYYLSLSAIHATAPDCQISIRLSNLSDGLQLQIVTEDPLAILRDATTIEDRTRSISPPDLDLADLNNGQDLRISLGLSLSQTLAISHGGKIESIVDGRGYQLSLPLIVADR
jgi:signal transduction histidine kinase